MQETNPPCHIILHFVQNDAPLESTENYAYEERTHKCMRSARSHAEQISIASNGARFFAALRFTQESVNANHRGRE
jgi:hypothetical protein